jgi:hypothetical protein
MVVGIRVRDEIAARVEDLAAGRPLVIDHFASRRCGITIGDLRARFGADLGDTRVDEAEPIGKVPVLIERELVALLGAGSSLRMVGPGFAPRLAVALDRPEAWLDFLHSHPHTRR